MLAVQVIHIEYHKAEKIPAYAELRRKFENPKKLTKKFIADNQADIFFLNYNQYFQKNNNFMDIYEYRIEGLKYFKFYNKKAADYYFKETEQIRQKRQGAFYENAKDLKIPCVDIQKQNNDYAVRWYSDSAFIPLRKGRNERYFSNTEFRQKNILNHTVFTLKPGESGKLQYNWRYVYRDTGEWQYNMVYVYMINTKEQAIPSDIFTKERYVYEYKELAELF